MDQRQLLKAMELRLEREMRVERARRGLLNFTRFTKPDYEVNWHHRVMAHYLNQVVDGAISRLIICMPPRHGKSEMASVRFPAYLLGRNPKAQIIAASYNATLAAKMNRSVQRVIDSENYRTVFPDTMLNGKNIRSTSAGSWLRNTDEFEVVNHGGFYRSAGVGGSATGYGATCGIIDDPVKNREEANSATYRERNWDWYTSTFYSRLEKHGSILICACLTGDTLVLMADGSQKILAKVQPGDRVATYDRGLMSTSVVKNWINHGPDSVFKIETKSGTTVRGNKRHPFLILRNGVRQWVRLKDLKLTDSMTHVGVNGQVSLARQKAAQVRLSAKQCACRTTTKTSGQEAFVHLQHPHKSLDCIDSNIDMGLRKQRISNCLNCKRVFVQSAKTSQSLASTCQRLGLENFAWTMTTRLARSAVCCVMNAILFLDTLTQRPHCNQQLFISDPIVSITSDGVEDVFDIEVDKTENFIANGLVSHNTRWHEDDLIGRLLRQAKEMPDADQWTVVNLAGICEEAGGKDDPREVGQPLWPNKYDLKRLGRIQATIGPRDWVSLYQQRPAPAEGEVIKKAWWRYWTVLPTAIDLLIVSADLNFKETQRSDYSVFQVWARAGKDYYLIAQTRARMGWIQQKAASWTLVEDYPDYNHFFIEDAANGPALVAEMRETFPAIIPVPAKGSKLTRLEAVSGLIEGGNVYLPDPSQPENLWVQDLISEVAVFPNGAHDDQVDALTMALSQMRARHMEFDFAAETVDKDSFTRGLSYAG